MPVPPADVAPADSVRLLTYNVHFADAARGMHVVEAHAELVAAEIRDLAPDIALLQEVMTSDYPDFVPGNPFRRYLQDRLPTYAWIAPSGVARLGDANAILFDPSRYMPIRQGLHWFSETPDVPDSRHWGNAFPRHVLWAVFYDAAVGRHILVANLHLDHLSRRMNRRALEQLPQVL